MLKKCQMVWDMYGYGIYVFVWGEGSIKKTWNDGRAMMSWKIIDSLRCHLSIWRIMLVSQSFPKTVGAVGGEKLWEIGFTKQEIDGLFVVVGPDRGRRTRWNLHHFMITFSPTNVALPRKVRTIVLSFWAMIRCYHLKVTHACGWHVMTLLCFANLRQTVVIACDLWTEDQTIDIHFVIFSFVFNI